MATSPSPTGRLRIPEPETQTFKMNPELFQRVAGASRSVPSEATKTLLQDMDFSNLELRVIAQHQ